MGGEALTNRICPYAIRERQGRRPCARSLVAGDARGAVEAVQFGSVALSAFARAHDGLFPFCRARDALSASHARAVNLSHPRLRYVLTWS